jgi:hypothetical protein
MNKIFKEVFWSARGSSSCGPGVCGEIHLGRFQRFCNYSHKTSGAFANFTLEGQIV